MDKYTVFGTDGTADVAQSQAKYAEALTAWKQTNELPQEKIEGAVEAVFDQFPGQRLAMPFLVANAVSRLGAAPGQHASLTKAVHGYLTAQSAKNTGRIDIAKGVHGGVTRLALPGQPVPPRPSKTQAQEPAQESTESAQQSA